MLGTNQENVFILILAANLILRPSTNISRTLEFTFT